MFVFTFYLAGSASFLSLFNCQGSTHTAPHSTTGTALGQEIRSGKFADIHFSRHRRFRALPYLFFTHLPSGEMPSISTG